MAIFGQQKWLPARARSQSNCSSGSKKDCPLERTSGRSSTRSFWLQFRQQIACPLERAIDRSSAFLAARACRRSVRRLPAHPLPSMDQFWGSGKVFKGIPWYLGGLWGDIRSLLEKETKPQAFIRSLLKILRCIKSPGCLQTQGVPSDHYNRHTGSLFTWFISNPDTCPEFQEMWFIIPENIEFAIRAFASPDIHFPFENEISTFEHPVPPVYLSASHMICTCLVLHDLTYESTPLSLAFLAGLIHRLGDPFPSRQLQFGSRYPVFTMVLSRYPVRYCGPVPYYSMYMYMLLMLHLLNSVTETTSRYAHVTSVIEDLAMCGCHLVCFLFPWIPYMFYIAYVFE